MFGLARVLSAAFPFLCLMGLLRATGSWGKILQIPQNEANCCFCSVSSFGKAAAGFSWQCWPNSLQQVLVLSGRFQQLHSSQSPPERAEILLKSIRNLGTLPWECALRASYLPAPQENPFLRGNLWGGCPLSMPCLSGLQIKGEHPSGLAEPISRYTSFSLGMGHPPRAEILPLATVQVVVGQQKRFVPAGEK